MIYLHCVLHWEQIMKPGQHTIKPLLNKHWISSSSRAGEQSVHLVLSSVEYRAAQGRRHNRSKIFITATNVQVSRTGEQDSMREQPSSGSDFMLQAAFPRLQKPTPPTPTFVFPLSLPFFSSVSAHEHECVQKLAYTLRRTNLWSERRHTGFHHQTGDLLMFDPWVPLQYEVGW